MRSLRKGRDALKRIVKNSKFREALERDVLKRKLKGTKLGMRYGCRFLLWDCFCGGGPCPPKRLGKIMKYRRTVVWRLVGTTP